MILQNGTEFSDVPTTEVHALTGCENNHWHDHLIVAKY